MRRKGYALILCNSDQEVEEETRLLKVLTAKKIDGLIFIGSGSYNKEIENLKEVKIVFLDRVYEKAKGYYVVADNERGMKELLEYLIDTGHRSFALLNGNEETFSAKERYKGFKDAMDKHGIKDYTVIFGSFTYESGSKMVRKLRKLPDAIVCGNDLIAFGVIDTLHSMGFSVPNDVSVTGFDDIPFSQHFKPPLTTVRQPAYELGRHAARTLIEALNGKRKRKKGVILPTELIIRESTKRR